MEFSFKLCLLALTFFVIFKFSFSVVLSHYTFAYRSTFLMVYEHDVTHATSVSQAECGAFAAQINGFGFKFNETNGGCAVYRMTGSNCAFTFQQFTNFYMIGSVPTECGKYCKNP